MSPLRTNPRTTEDQIADLYDHVRRLEREFWEGGASTTIGDTTVFAGTGDCDFAVDHNLVANDPANLTFMTFDDGFAAVPDNDGKLRVCFRTATYWSSGEASTVPASVTNLYISGRGEMAQERDSQINVLSFTGAGLQQTVFDNVAAEELVASQGRVAYRNCYVASPTFAGSQSTTMSGCIFGGSGSLGRIDLLSDCDFYSGTYTGTYQAAGTTVVVGNRWGVLSGGGNSTLGLGWDGGGFDAGGVVFAGNSGCQIQPGGHIGLAVDSAANLVVVGNSELSSVVATLVHRETGSGQVSYPQAIVSNNQGSILTISLTSTAIDASISIEDNISQGLIVTAKAHTVSFNGNNAIFTGNTTQAVRLKAYAGGTGAVSEETSAPGLITCNDNILRRQQDTPPATIYLLDLGPDTAGTLNDVRVTCGGNIICWFRSDAALFSADQQGIRLRDGIELVDVSHNIIEADSPYIVDETTGSVTILTPNIVNDGVTKGTI